MISVVYYVSDISLLVVSQAVDQPWHSDTHCSVVKCVVPA